MLPASPRVLAIRPGPHFSVKDVHDGWVEGLRDNGCTVVDLNLDDRVNFLAQAQFRMPDGTYRPAVPHEHAVRMGAKAVHEAAYEVWPDIVLITSGFWIEPASMELMRRRGHHVVLLLTESPYEDDRQLLKAPYADTVLINDPRNLDRFLQANRNTWYQPHGYRPSIHHPATVPPDVDVSFVGTGYPSRIRFLEQIDWTGIDLLLAGNWGQLDADSPLRRHVGHDIRECVDNTETADVYRRSKTSLNLYRKEASDTADGWAIGPREVELAACGVPFLREPRPESDELFPFLPSFTSPQELSDLLPGWLADDERRRRAACKAREAIADRTFTNHAAALLRRIDGYTQRSTA